MLSALQAKVGGQTSSSANPLSGLKHPRIAVRCSYVSSSISSLPVKELHQFFPQLLSNIFGFDNNGGWGLRQFNRDKHGDFHQILQFLGPYGELFHLIEKLETEDFIYEFPVECLPRPSQHALSEGNIPSFYVGKVQLSLSVDNSPTHILLSAFEYYIFHLAYYLIYSQKFVSPLPPGQNFADSLFVVLLDSYFNRFLPYTGTVPPSSTSSFHHQNHSFYPSTPHFNNTSFGSSMSHSPMYKVTSPLRGGTKTFLGSSSKHSSQKITHSETFVQVMVEFWLNQNSYNGGRGDLLAQAQNQFNPSEDHIMLLRRLIKQVHYFGCGHSYSSTTPTTHSHLLPVTDALRSSLVLVYLQKRLFHFLNYSFKHSPLDHHFRYILELWLTFIQPWRYVDPTKSPTENKESFNSLPKRWRLFVLDNLPFYATLLVEFLSRFSQADLARDPNVTLLFRASKVFALPQLIGFIQQGEELLLDPAQNYSRGNSPSSASSVKAVFTDCVGPAFNFTPLFGQDTQNSVFSLLYKVCRYKRLLSHQTQSTQPARPISPARSDSFSLSTSQPSPSSSRSFFQSLWDSLFQDGDKTSPWSGSHQSTDPEKLLSMLENISQNLSTTFNLPIPKESNLDSSTLGLDNSFETSIMGHPLISPPPTSLEPEYIKGTCRLSPKGKMQVMQGLRVPSGKQIRFLGDPLLQPIRSYESVTLVRALYRLSSFLNEKYSEQLTAVGTGNGLLHALVRQLLSPPPPRPHSTLTYQYSSDPPVTPLHRISPVISYPDDDDESPPPVPRINLRPLGSYYTLFYIGLVLVLVWLFSVPTLYCLLGLFCFVFMYCVGSYFVHGTAKSK